MKIHFTKREYQVLMELVQLGNWMLHSHDEYRDRDDSPHNLLAQKIYSLAKDMGCEDLVMNSDGMWYESREFEDAMQEHVQNYDEQSFWSELPSRLAMRDVERSVGRDAFAAMDPEERFGMILDHEERWMNEFAEHGLSRLVLSAVVTG